MDDKGQVYFNAGDGEIPQEDAARYEAASLEEIHSAFAREAAERERRDRQLTARQREHIKRRTARKEALEAQAKALDRAQEQKDESVMKNHEIVGEFDACKWADFWLKTIKDHPEIVHDRMTMVGWFANAIMAGYDRARNEIANEAAE